MSGTGSGCPPESCVLGQDNEPLSVAISTPFTHSRGGVFGPPPPGSVPMPALHRWKSSTGSRKLVE